MHLFMPTHLPLASVIDASPGLAFWTLVTVTVVFFVLTWKVWKPLAAAIDEREKSIRQAVDQAKLEREQAEKLLADQQKAIAEARREAGEMVRKSQAEVEKSKEALFAQARTEAEAFLKQARQQIQEEKQKALAEVKDIAVELAIAAAGKILAQQLDGPKQRALAEEYIQDVQQKAVQQKNMPRAAVGA